MTDDPLRSHLLRVLDWGDAHANFDRAVEGMPPELRGVRPDGLPYSAWELLEHIRRAQHDILEFCRDPAAYTEPRWPEDYWPQSPTLPRSGAWNESIAGFRADLQALKQLVSDPAVDLFAAIPHGDGPTYLREILLVADHNAYHVGEIVVVRKLLGAWK